MRTLQDFLNEYHQYRLLNAARPSIEDFWQSLSEDSRTGYLESAFQDDEFFSMLVLDPNDLSTTSMIELGYLGERDQPLTSLFEPGQPTDLTYTDVTSYAAVTATFTRDPDSEVVTTTLRGIRYAVTNPIQIDSETTIAFTNFSVVAYVPNVIQELEYRYQQAFGKDLQQCIRDKAYHDVASMLVFDPALIESITAGTWHTLLTESHNDTTFVHEYIQMADEQHIQTVLAKLRGLFPENALQELLSFNLPQQQPNLTILNKRFPSVTAWNKLFTAPVFSRDSKIIDVTESRQSTHSTTIHASVAISLVKLTKRFAQAHNLSGLDFQKATVTLPLTRLESSVEMMLQKLAQQLTDTLNTPDLELLQRLNLEAGAQLFTPADIAQYKKQCEVAMRYVTNVIKGDDFGNGMIIYPTRPSEEYGAGLSIQEITAVTYWSLTDQGVTLGPEQAFKFYVKYLKEIMRDYNPDENDYSGPDENKCPGGTINHLVAALNIMHPSVNIANINSAMLNEEINCLFHRFILEENGATNDDVLKALADQDQKNALCARVYDKFRHYADDKLIERFEDFVIDTQFLISPMRDSHQLSKIVTLGSLVDKEIQRKFNQLFQADALYTSLGIKRYLELCLKQQAPLYCPQGTKLGSLLLTVYLDSYNYTAHNENSRQHNDIEKLLKAHSQAPTFKQYLFDLLRNDPRGKNHLYSLIQDGSNLLRTIDSNLSVLHTLASDNEFTWPDTSSKDDFCRALNNLLGDLAADPNVRDFWRYYHSTDAQLILRKFFARFNINKDYSLILALGEANIDAVKAIDGPDFAVCAALENIPDKGFAHAIYAGDFRLAASLVRSSSANKYIKIDNSKFMHPMALAIASGDLAFMQQVGKYYDGSHLKSFDLIQELQNANIALDSVFSEEKIMNLCIEFLNMGRLDYAEKIDPTLSFLINNHSTLCNNARRLFSLSVVNNDIRSIQLLFAHFSDQMQQCMNLPLKVTNSELFATALHWTISENQLELFDYLLSQGAEPLYRFIKGKEYWITSSIVYQMNSPKREEYEALLRKHDVLAKEALFAIEHNVMDYFYIHYDIKMSVLRDLSSKIPLAFQPQQLDNALQYYEKHKELAVIIAQHLPISCSPAHIRLLEKLLHHDPYLQYAPLANKLIEHFSTHGHPFTLQQLSLIAARDAALFHQLITRENPPLSIQKLDPSSRSFFYAIESISLLPKDDKEAIAYIVQHFLPSNYHPSIHADSLPKLSAPQLTELFRHGATIEGFPRRNEYPTDNNGTKEHANAVKKYSPTLYRAFELALEHGDTKLLDSFIETKVNLEQLFAKGMTTLMVAATNLEHGASLIERILKTLGRQDQNQRALFRLFQFSPRFIDAKNAMDQSALYVAINSGNHAAISVLLTHGATVDQDCRARARELGITLPDETTRSRVLPR